MTYGLAFSLFSNVHGRARPNLTGRLLKERGTWRSLSGRPSLDIPPPLLAGETRYVEPMFLLSTWCYTRYMREYMGICRTRARARGWGERLWRVWRDALMGTSSGEKQRGAGARRVKRQISRTTDFALAKCSHPSPAVTSRSTCRTRRAIRELGARARLQNNNGTRVAALLRYDVDERVARVVITSRRYANRAYRTHTEHARRFLSLSARKLARRIIRCPKLLNVA